MLLLLLVMVVMAVPVVVENEEVEVLQMMEMLREPAMEVQKAEVVGWRGQLHWHLQAEGFQFSHRSCSGFHRVWALLLVCKQLLRGSLTKPMELLLYTYHIVAS